MSDHKAIQLTISSKIVGLITAFGLVLLSTKILGTQGRGYISLVLADAALVGIVSNILGGSSAMYFAKKIGENKIITTALIWIVISSLMCSWILSLFQPVEYFLLVLLSFSLSFSSLIINNLLTNQDFVKGNFLSAFTQLLFTSLITLFWITSYNCSWQTYFYSQSIILILSCIYFLKNRKLEFINRAEFSLLFKYGFRNELSYIFQFLSYRISYFFIFKELGAESLGVFGILIIFAESIWVGSKSISLVLFTKQLDKKGGIDGIKRTNKFAIYSFCFSFIALIFLLLIPEYWIFYLFSNNLTDWKKILFILTPGILCIAVTNVYGHFFAAENEQRVLILKSVVGFIISAIFTPTLIHYFQLMGAAIAMSLSYLVSSLILIVAYSKISREIIKLNE